MVRLLLEKRADPAPKDEVSAVRVVHVGYVALLPANLLYPCLTASSVSCCREDERR
jgi:hypothetical protein